MKLNINIIEKEHTIKKIDKFMTELINENEKLNYELKNFNKDEEIQKLMNEIQELRQKSIYMLNDKEHKDFNIFKEEHGKKCNTYPTIIINGTGLGDIIKLHCPICNEEKDITDISCW